MAADPRLTGNVCRCAACGEYFQHPNAFEKHRVGTYQPDTRRCLTAAEMDAQGFERDPRGNRKTPLSARKRAQLAALKTRVAATVG